MTDQQCPLYPLVYSLLVGFQRPPCINHQVTRNSSHRLMKPRPWALWSHFEFRDLTSVNRGIRFQDVQHYYPDEFNILKFLGTDIKICGNLCCKHYNVLIWLQMLWRHQTQMAFCLSKAECWTRGMNNPRKQTYPSRMPLPTLRLHPDLQTQVVQKVSFHAHCRHTKLTILSINVGT